MSTTARDDDVATGRPDERPMRKDAARNRALLIAAGREVFARRGLEASLDDIAHEAGVGVGTAYRHFGNKFDLATAIMTEAIGEIVVLAERGAAADDPWTGLTGFLQAVLELQTKDRGLREVMMGAQDPKALQAKDEVHDRLRPPIATMLQRAKDAGDVRDDVALTDLGALIAMLCHVADLGATARPDLWQRYLPAMLAGLRPDGPPFADEPLTDAEFEAASKAYATRALAVAVTEPI